MIDPTIVFIDGTHIKASANKKKFQKEQVAKTAKVYEKQLKEEVAAERAELGKKPTDDDDDNDGGTVTKTVSTTDPDCGMFVKGSHERQFAYEAHTACDRHGFILGAEVTAGNVNDNVAWDAVYDQVTKRFPEVEFVAMDAGYKTPWIAKKTFDDGRVPILPYTRYKGNKDTYRPWDFTYDILNDSFICPQGFELRHTTTNKDGRRTYRSTTSNCKNCPCRKACTTPCTSIRVQPNSAPSRSWTWTAGKRRRWCRIPSLPDGIRDAPKANVWPPSPNGWPRIRRWMPGLRQK